MSLIARLFWTAGNDTEIDKALAQHYILEYLEHNQIAFSVLVQNKQ